MIIKLFSALHADENILYFEKDFGSITFSFNEISILNIGLNWINLDDTNFDEDNSGTITHVRLGFAY